RRIGEKRERANMASARNLHLEEAGRVHAPRHFALPEPRQRAAHALGVDAVGDSPARAAAAQAHHQAGLALGAGGGRRQVARGRVVTVDQAVRFLAVRNPRRPHERAVAEHPEVAFRQTGHELVQGHRVTLTRRAPRRLTRGARLPRRLPARSAPCRAAYKIGAMSARRPPLVGRYTGEELALAGRNRGMPLEALRHDVTPSGLHYLLVHFDIPPEPAGWKLRVNGV